MAATNNRESLEELVRRALKEIGEIRAAVEEVRAGAVVSNETMARLDMHVSNLSYKVDLDISSVKSNGALQMPRKSDEPKKKYNVMSFFKMRWVEDPASIADVVDEKEVADVYERNKAKIEAKKAPLRPAFKAGLVYSELIKGSTDRMNRVRAIKDAEEARSAEANFQEIAEEPVEDDFYDDEVLSD